jgi:hypothetical protein
MRRAAEEGRPVHTSNQDEASDGIGSSGALVVPLKVRGHVIGVLDARKSSEGGADDDLWMSDEISLLESLAQQLGVALESARLYQDTQRRAARERVVSEVAAQMRESLDLTTVLKSGARGIREAMGLPAVTVRLVDGDADGGA